MPANRPRADIDPSGPEPPITGCAFANVRFKASHHTAAVFARST